ncbi:hypothetical protein ANSO36C_67530 (plasmid) [Nostoc cf. commune SO-36]|uniref:Uncharacterized protein n=1 Tax=Nostoc cf. commune SO-36 TaxID=449208 RepID=A0ABM7ZCD0_NOSCO|nr:hypothetical protein [Nostoc commune]BDI20951.1 hypothetical protein ANSO36C_67530 [Nostoc cf. commune SO-36]
MSNLPVDHETSQEPKPDIVKQTKSSLTKAPKSTLAIIIFGGVVALYAWMIAVSDCGSKVEAQIWPPSIRLERLACPPK